MTAHKSHTPKRSRRTSAAGDGILGDRANDALTNLLAYALTLDVEYHRLDDQLLELAKGDSEAGDRRALMRERDEVGAQREALRRSVNALREQATQSPDVRR